MIGERSRLSLAQYLELQNERVLDVLFRKHGLQGDWARAKASASNTSDALVALLPSVAFDRLSSVLAEVVSTEGYLRDQAIGEWGQGRESYVARWRDLELCLRLDNYEISGGSLRGIDPALPETATPEDALTTAVRSSTLPKANDIVELLRQSARDFRAAPPDYNGCLINTRVSLETLAREVAVLRRQRHEGSFDESSWGEVMAYLRRTGFVDAKEENMICRVYDLLSDGAHVPIGLTREQWVLLGRRMAMSAAYLLIMRHNAGT